MSDSVKIGHLMPVKSPLLVQGKTTAAKSSQSGEFRSMLDAKVLHFSHHAEVRMKQRGIQLQPESLTKIMNAVEEAESKGAIDSLIVMKDVAMIVNVPSRTVVTAMDGKQLQSNVFTQIDSAVILNE
ncbi:TIGR02530 family flagellar biosynthesis protein [Paenibacillus sp. NEAU-GSW1]|uniref:TIGR02530 family flagellar biosynthesis protein n=1 Tax=Paenibacillus sp. NEAU-GSW1 TaxID=2682486 RepID=UPI0012E14FBA|nr:TIGR02530 family flagellar biosynthesis protein [Paenibacillus sp. NEAU-GSW1]MUT66358.1 flagellar biosynthesis protein [Paenibacillus sp. NEAU-GSW1]